ncbi:MAG: RNA polymerase sigma factor [Planctomycetes bacterium]|nr:RNA polymerase sigma factor [Planctomycetota bacterium]
MTTPTDETLLRQYRERKQNDALDELVRRHIGKVRSMIYQMVLDHADADDLTQEVFCRALVGLDEFRGTARFSSWLYTIAVHTTQSFLAARTRFRRMDSGPLDEKIDAGAAPDERLLGAEVNDAIHAALASLSPTLRSAIVLTALQEMGMAEAAAISQCALPTFYWRVHRARAILGKKLGGILKP